MEPVDSFKIPVRYNFTIGKLKKGDRFNYLEFDGSNFFIPVERVKQFYLDLRDLLPEGELINKILVKMGGAFDKWKSSVKEDDIEGIPDSVEEDLDFEFIEDFLVEDLPRELRSPHEEDHKKDIDWEKVAKIFLIILFILFMIAIIGGIILLAAGGADDIDIPVPSFDKIDLPRIDIPDLHLNGDIMAALADGAGYIFSGPVGKKKQEEDLYYLKE